GCSMSALAKTSTANAQATQHRTSPFSTASPSTCSNRTKPANAESTENASRPVGTMTTYFNSSDIKMRLPCSGYEVTRVREPCCCMMRNQPVRTMHSTQSLQAATRRPWIFDLTRDERATLIATFGGWALDGMDVMIYSFVIPTLIAVW